MVRRAAGEADLFPHTPALATRAGVWGMVRRAAGEADLFLSLGVFSLLCGRERNLSGVEFWYLRICSAWDLYWASGALGSALCLLDLSCLGKGTGWVGRAVESWVRASLE